jgi:hypothetical protein
MKGMRIAIRFSILIVIFFIARSVRAYGVTVVIPDNYPNIQAGIDAAASGDTVLVRDGTYLLTAAIDFKGKTITVRSENGAGNCFLDGQNNTRVVYFHSGESSRSVLSGFTIRNGRAIYAPQAGAGIYFEGASPTITDCTIIANIARAAAGLATAYAYGGGIYSTASSPTIRNCTIQGNRAEASASGRESIGYGGGIYISGGSPIIANCLISGNTASGGYYAYGGGIYSTGSSPNIANSTISNNSVASGTSNAAEGGGIYFANSIPSIVNCTINGNSAKDGAGLYFSQSSTFSTLTNCTIVRNTAVANGGGLYLKTSTPRIINSILWEDSPQEVYSEGAGSPNITYSDIYGGYTGSGNISGSPGFVSIGQQDYHLISTSPAINAGSNAAPELPTQDKEGSNRIIDSIVDMGAYEYSSSQASDVIVYPQLAVGGGYEVVLIVSNKSNTSWSGIAKPLSADKSFDYLITSIQLAAGQTKKITLSGGPSTIATGLEIYGNPGYRNSALSVSYFFNFYQDGRLTDSTGVPKSQAAKKFTFPVEKSKTVDTGLAIRRRAHQVDSPITITLVDAQGKPIQQVSRGSNFANFFTEQFTGVPSQFIGSVVAESLDEFYLVVIRLEETLPGFQLTSVPAEAN